MPVSTEPPSYRHHKARGQAVVRLCGKDFYLGPYGTKVSRDNYDRIVGEWLAAGRTLPREQTAGTMTVVDLVNAYHKAGEVLPSHAHKGAVRPLVRLYGRTQAEEFGPLALKAVRTQMVAAGWKRNTVNSRVNLLRRVFRWGVEHEMIVGIVAQALDAVAPLKEGRTVAPESDETQPVAIEHVETILPRLSPTVATMVRMQVYTGMRAKELCEMRTGEVETTGGGPGDATRGDVPTRRNHRQVPDDVPAERHRDPRRNRVPARDAE